MTVYRDLSATRDESGWSEWIWPGEVYKTACCDCGLVHEIAFALIDGKIAIAFHRDNRATAQIRRHRKHKCQSA